MRPSKEQDNWLSFLDVLITYTEQRFSSSVYQKPSFTGQYLNFNSYHPYNVQKGIIHCLQYKVKVISSDSNAYHEEIKDLRDNLCRNNNSESITLAPTNLDQTNVHSIWKFTPICLSYVKSQAKKIGCLYDIKPPTEYNLTKNCMYKQFW